MDNPSLNVYIAMLRDHAGKPLPTESDLIVPCQYCRAEAGHWCYVVRGTVTFTGAATRLHKVRLEEAKRLRDKGEIRSDKGWTKVADVAACATSTPAANAR